MSIHATIIGNLGRDPETRQAGSSTVCSFSVATSYGYGDRKTTTWVRVSVWGKQGETCMQYLSKGKQVAAMGLLHTREHEGKTYVELDAKQVTFLGGRDEGQQDRGRPGGRQKGGQAGGYNDDDIPF